MRSVLLLSFLATAAAAQAPSVSYPQLLQALHAGASAEQRAAIQAFATQPDAADALADLLATIRAEAPELDNHGCIAVEAILRAHPAAICLIE